MENAHPVGRRLPAEVEPEARGYFSKPKGTFLGASCMTQWHSSPTCRDTQFGPYLPCGAGATSQDLHVPAPAIPLSEDLLPPPCHLPVLLGLAWKPSPFLSPAQFTPCQELEKPSPEERQCGGQGLRWQSSARQAQDRAGCSG